MNYKKAIQTLTSQGKFYVDLSLERITEALATFGNPQDELKCVHVAGTNGKGSVCAILGAILQAQGYKVGVYTSPHIFEYTERIQINGVQISKDVFAQKVLQMCNLSVHLTEFEILTATAFEYFMENKVDYVILETGLGGRLDATNVIKHPICSIITHIDFDHTERLGDTIEKIAKEKAGIIKEGCPTLVGADNKGLEVVKRYCNPIIVENIENSSLSLKGRHQMENLALALGAIKLIDSDIAPEVVEYGISHVKHPCRFEFVKEKNLIIDGAHNPNGIAALRDNLDIFFPNIKRRFIFGCLKNKDYPKMIDILFKSDDEIYFNTFSNPNSASFEELQKTCKFSAKKFKTLSGINFSADVLTIICGSFYMLSEVLGEKTEDFVATKS